MEQERRRNQSSYDQDDDAMRALAVVAAFGVGMVAGAIAMLLSAPESGPSVRRKLKRGAEVAKRELEEILDETKESWTGVRDEAREAVKRTTSRLREAAHVTKEAIREGESSKPTTP